MSLWILSIPGSIYKRVELLTWELYTAILTLELEVQDLYRYMYYTAHTSSYTTIITGDTGLRGPVGETGNKGDNGEQGTAHCLHLSI